MSGTGAGTLRVAAAQFAVGLDLEANLAACLHALDGAGEGGAELVVLPEFCNHLSWYDDAAHCYRVSLDLDGPFLAAIAGRARQIGAYVVVNCTLRRGGGAASGSSLMFSPAGELLGVSDKQVLMGHENDFLRRAEAASPLLQAGGARVAMYACMDGVINETPRCLALRGAQVLCNSLNSFAFDEGSLHVPVRAAENRVFVVAANKVGPLVPEALVGAISESTGIPAPFLDGAGESQVVAPDGEVLARAQRRGEQVVFADISPARAENKRRPGGSDIFAARRPELYGAIAADPAGQAEGAGRGAAVVEAAAIQLQSAGVEAIAEARQRCAAAFDAGVQLAVLPELFCFEQARVDDAAEAARRTEQAVAALAAACGAQGFAVASLVQRQGAAFRHAALLIGGGGVLAAQPQLHRCARHPWAEPGEGVVLHNLPFGRVGMVVGEDSIYPETFRLLALAGAEIAAASLNVEEDWELRLGLVERAAENRLNLVAASRAESGGSLAAALVEDFTLMTPWKEREFDGLISQPEVQRAAGAGALRAQLRPAAAANKLLSHRTHLLRDRPWPLLDALTAARGETR